MYGGYRDPTPSADKANPPTRRSAPTNANGLRGLCQLSGVTMPMRTQDLLKGIQEVYDDMDNSASKHTANPPEDDPLISWDKQSFPKGLEWITPALKSKALNSNIIPETVGNLSSKDVNHSRAGGATDKPYETLDDKMKLDSNVVIPTPPVVFNEFDKENIFLHMKSDVQLPNPHGLLSSTKKNLQTKTISEGNFYHLNDDLVHRPVQKEDLFTPLKRVDATTPVTGTAKLTSVHSTRKIPSIPENSLSYSNLSPRDNLMNLMSGRKSPLSMEPHLSLLTPITRSRPSSSVQSTSKKLAFSSTSYHQDNQHASNLDNMDVWKTPAKGFCQVRVNPQAAKAEKSFDQVCYAVPLEEKLGERNIKPAAECKPMDVLNVKLTAPKGPEEIPQFQDASKMTPYSGHAPRIVSSCISTPASVSTLKSLPRSCIEMPPPLEVRRQPVKASPESLPHSMSHSIGHSMNHSIGPTVGEKNSSNEIYVNGKPYTIMSILGRGGSSVVYLVLEPGTSNLMAIKCVNLSELDQSTYDGYLNEIALLAQLQDSDCVIRMFDHQHCKEEKLLYVVMEKGETDLSQLIRAVSRTKKISTAMIVYYWIEMLNAVSFIHKKGTIHSDLKPANFLLVSGRLKLIDFGIAAVIQADMTSVMKDNMTGTYNYISPEAICSTGSGPDGRNVRFKISYKSDVWSLGCILYNLVYGHTPFQMIVHQFAKMKAIADPNHKISFPPAPGCPQALLHAMQACLVRDPKLRPSVDDLLKYPYFGSVEPPLNDRLSGLLEQINSVAHSTQNSSDKIMSIQSLLSAFQLSKKIRLSSLY